MRTTLLPKVIGRFNFYLISMLSALKRALTAKNSRELSGGLLDVMGMLLLLGGNPTSDARADSRRFLVTDGNAEASAYCRESHSWLSRHVLLSQDFCRYRLS